MKGLKRQRQPLRQGGEQQLHRAASALRGGHAARVEAGEGRPDGLTVDAEGCVWCALWDGWCVRRFAPDGQTMRDLRLPVPRPTSVAFGGNDHATLFVTSARIRLPAKLLAEAPYSGGLFAATVGVRGKPAGMFSK